MVSKLNADIRDAIDGMYEERARELLREALKEADGETYYQASRVALDDNQKRMFLQKALDLDPFHARAYKEIQALTVRPVTATAPAQAVIPTAQLDVQPVIAPPPAPVVSVQSAREPEPPPQPKTLLAKIGHSTTLYQYPWPKASIRSNVSSNTVCIPLARTESGRWINVLYVGTTGHEVLGWIEAHDLSEVKFGNNSVSLYDLPITQFEYNSKQDIVELMKKVQSSTVWAGLWWGFAILPLFYALIAGAIYRYDSPSQIAEAMTARYVGGGLLVLMILLGTVALRGGIAKISHNLGGNAFQWTQRLNNIRRGKQSATENMMEDQARIAAMAIGGSLANTYLSKKMTSKSDVTIRYR
ncbi:MAG: hypothetical protein SF123_08715 [Chloroflexota bacterium]|nr:hypothetical protein [Chloroflexota bacterium]